MAMSRMNPGGAPIIIQIAEPNDELEAAIARMDRALAKSLTGDLPYLGVWREGMKCEPGHFVTDKGSMWHCDSASAARPSESPDCFTLAVKKGRDARGGPQ